MSELQTSADAPPRCVASKADGTPCSRTVAKGQRHCWQHAHGLRAKFRALIRNQPLTFGLATLIGVLGLSATLCEWKWPHFWEKRNSAHVSGTEAAGPVATAQRAPSPPPHRDETETPHPTLHGQTEKSQVSPPQPPTVIEIAPAFGNIKERAVALSQEIMQDLYMHGWREGDPRVPHVLPPIEHMKIPPAATLEQMEDWTRRRSDKFRYVFLPRVLEIRNEFAQLHLRDRELDEFFETEETISQASRQLAGTGQQRHVDRVILPQEIEEVAERLRALAGQIPRH